MSEPSNARSASARRRRTGARRRRPLRAGKRRRHLQHRDLSGPRRLSRRLCQRARRRSLFRRDRVAGPGRRRRHRSDPARRRPLAGRLADRRRPQGERRTFTWREAAPARELFELPKWSRVAEGLTRARLIYFSGITLSLYSNIGLGRFLAAIELARSNGAKVAFDGNFRPRDWKGDLTRTRTVFAEALKRVDIALPAYDDEAVLWGDPSPEATIERLQAFGVDEIVVKNGPNSALVAIAGSATRCRCRKWWCRSMPRRPATASMPAIWRRAFPAAPRWRRRRRAQAGRPGDPPSRRHHAARGRGGALARRLAHDLFRKPVQTFGSSPSAVFYGVCASASRPARRSRRPARPDGAHRSAPPPR